MHSMESAIKTGAMRSPSRRTGALLLLFAMTAAMTTAGCSRTGAFATLGLATVATGGVAGYYYAKGDLESNLDYDFESVHRAAIDSVKSSGYEVTEEVLEKSGGKVIAHRQVTNDKGENEDERVLIKTKSADAGGTHVSIRIGIWGGEESSSAILSSIEQILNR